MNAEMAPLVSTALIHFSASARMGGKVLSVISVSKVVLEKFDLTVVHVRLSGSTSITLVLKIYR